MRSAWNYVRSNYGTFAFDCKDYEALIALMQHDKKNQGGEINFTLLDQVGQLHLDSHATREQIKEMFDFFTNV